MANNKNPESNLVENINYKLGFDYEVKKNKYKYNSYLKKFIVFVISVIKKVFNMIKNLFKYAIPDIFINLYDAKKYSYTITLININRLNIDQIKDYIFKNYYGKLNKPEEIDRDKLLNDLVVFKAYKEDLEINIKNDNLFKEFFELLLKVVTIFISLNSIIEKIDVNIERSKGLVIDLGFLTILMIGFLLIWIFMTIGKNSDSSRLKVVNYGIYTLEAIKEDMVEVSEDKAYKLVAKRLINENSDECLDPNIHYVMFMESLEDNTK